MGKKKKTSLNYVFANNLPKVEVAVVEEPAVEPEETILIDEEEKEEEPTEEVLPPEPLEKPVSFWTDDNLILIVAIASLLCLLTSACLFYGAYSYYRAGQEVEIEVDTQYEELHKVVKAYVATIKDPRKEELCSKLRMVYLTAASSTADINVVIGKIKEDSRAILGFDESKATTNEYEWQKLFDASGIINTWLSDEGIQITKENQRAFFTAIAEGLK